MISTVIPLSVCSVNSYTILCKNNNDEATLSDIISDKSSDWFVTADASQEEEEEMSLVSIDKSESDSKADVEEELWISIDLRVAITNID